VQFGTIQALAAYWAGDHDWRMFEERFAALPHLIIEIDGVDRHQTDLSRLEDLVGHGGSNRASSA
jgi:Epoxide hydrolase N terminus